ncbi:MAG TPA: hypothetical protein EYN54_09240 [Methylococcaceae bacterium]|nr:hypothetical protein [Methylococcaceae bacterium]
MIIVYDGISFINKYSGNALIMKSSFIAILDKGTVLMVRATQLDDGTVSKCSFSIISKINLDSFKCSDNPPIQLAILDKSVIEEIKGDS